MFFSFINSIKYLFKILKLNNKQKKFIKFNQNKWKKSNLENPQGIILVDLFPWYPWIYFWSYLANILSKKINTKIYFFHFRLYKGFISKKKFSINNLIKIYKSFNVNNGISEYEIDFSNKKKNEFLDLYRTLKSKKDLLNYYYENIKIGDLIYSNYLRTYLKPTVDLNDKKLKDIFVRAHFIFEYLDDFFSKNTVKAIIPSHLCYVPYGLISRLAKKKYNIPIVKIFSKNRGGNLYRLFQIDENILDENPYYNFKKIFNELDPEKKIKAIEKGKKIINARLSGSYDKNLPYMLKNQFDSKTIKNLQIDPEKKNIFIFAHCFFDNPMRYRNMIFPDFYEQIDYLLSLSEKDDNYQWFYKPHPNELKNNENLVGFFENKYKKVKYLSKDFNHNSVLKLNPHLAITNFGTVAHEFAYMNVPVINTGDNPHINYNFSLHPKNIDELNDMIFNLNNYVKKINFNKDEIYEYLFMQYDFFPNLNNENKLLSDDYFNITDRKYNSDDDLLNHFMKNDEKNSLNIKKYTEDFIDKFF